MINSKFLKIQIKSSIWITFGIALIPIIISILSMSFTAYFWDTTINNANGSISYSGAINILGLTTLFGPVGEIIAVAFAVSLAIKLINTEISKGYISSWLSLPMSKITVLLTKILTIFLASLIIVISNLLIEFIIVAIRHYSDFGSIESWILIKLNLGLMLVFFFTTSIAVIFSVLFNKTSYAITLSIIVPLIFIVFFVISSFMSNLNGLSFFQYFKYATFFSLFDFKQLIDNNLYFIWKFILLFVFGLAIFLASVFIFKEKNLFI